MSKSASGERAGRRGRAQASAARRARNCDKARAHARRRFWLLGGGLGTLIVVALALVVWLALGRPGLSNDIVLHRFDPQDYYALAFDPSNPDTLYVGQHDGMEVSHDAGKGWQETVARNIDLTGIGLSVADPQRRYLAARGMFVLSTDGGQTWEQPQQNLPNVDLRGFAVAPGDPWRLYAYAYTDGSGKLYSSKDGGFTWEERALPEGARLTGGGSLPLAVAPDDPLHLYAAAGDQLAESRDGGQTWTTQPSPVGTIESLAIAPTSPPLFYAGTDDGLWRMPPGGTWQRMPLEPDGPVLAVAISPTNPARVAVLDQAGKLYRSDDGGHVWVH